MTVRSRWQGLSTRAKTATTGVVAAGAITTAAISGGCLYNPAPERGLSVDLETVPLAGESVDEATWTQPDGTPYPSPGQGKFRTSCGPSHYNWDDAIVFPGQRGSTHLHGYSGNDASYEATTAANILDAGSTCEGGATNRTSYWHPALFLRDTGRVIGNPVGFQDTMQVYYQAGYDGIWSHSTEWFPEGLRMIAGGATTPVVDPANPRGEAKRRAYWNCLPAGNPRADASSAQHETIQATGCRPGQYLQAVGFFPQCSDGRNLDSPDHRSHMAYGMGWPDKGCPPSHPVARPQIQVFARWWLPIPGTPADTRQPGCEEWPRFNPYDEAWPHEFPEDEGEPCELMPDYDIADLALTSDMYLLDSPEAGGGRTIHFDWFNGWDPAVGRSINQCVTREIDCGQGLILPENWSASNPRAGVRKLGPVPG